MKSPAQIQEIFAAVAPRYDRANTFLSFGIHHLWRKTLVNWSGAKEGDAVLDCATGTGDLAIAFKRAVGPSGGVLGTDFCREMLFTAPAKAQEAGLNVHFEQADVTALPYPDSSFDISSIAFGIRNVPQFELGIKELSRVTRPGGVVMILEFGQPRIPGWKQLYKFYSQRILPKLGGAITGHPEAYRYLEESSAQFPCGESFAELMKSQGTFSSVEVKSLSGGIAYIYKARRA